MATPNVQARTGNRIVVLMDGVRVGMIQSVRASDDYAPEPASGIGDIHVQEYVPTMARHNVAVTEMVLKAGNMRSVLQGMENGDAVLQGLVFDFLVMSKDDGAVLRKYVKCSYASGDVEVQKHQIVITNATFNALDVQGTGV